MVAQEGTGPQLDGSTTELHEKRSGSCGSGTHMSSVHRRLSLQRAVLGECKHWPPTQESVVQGLPSSQLIGVCTQPTPSAHLGTEHGSLEEQKLSSGVLMHPMPSTQKSSVQSMLSLQSTRLQSNTVVVVVVVVGVPGRLAQPATSGPGKTRHRPGWTPEEPSNSALSRFGHAWPDACE